MSTKQERFEVQTSKDGTGTHRQSGESSSRVRTCCHVNVTVELTKVYKRRPVDERWPDGSRDCYTDATNERSANGMDTRLAGARLRVRAQASAENGAPGGRNAGNVGTRPAEIWRDIILVRRREGLSSVGEPL